MKTFLLVEDHPVTRSGTVRLLEENGPWKCIGAAETAQETLSMLERLDGEKKLPLVLVCDIELKDGRDGIFLIKNVKQSYPGIKCVCLSMYDQPGIVQTALNAGADGYLSKTADVSEILQCMESVAAGRRYVEQGLAQDVAEYNKITDGLTKREKEALRMLLRHKSNDEMSRELGISKHAVENLISNIYAKSDCKNRGELCRKFANSLSAEEPGRRDQESLAAGFGEERVMLVNFSYSFNTKCPQGLPVYDAARGVWYADMAKAKNTDYVVAVANGVIRAVFKPERWFSAESDEAANLVAEFERYGVIHTGVRLDGRIAFEGTAAKEEWVGKSCPVQFERMGPVCFM